MPHIDQSMAAEDVIQIVFSARFTGDGIPPPTYFTVKPWDAA